MKICFITANYVAEQTGFNMTKGWQEGDDAANAWYRSEELFPARMETLMARIKGLGFDAISLWTAHLNWTWGTDRHVAALQRILREQGLQLLSYAGPFGENAADFSKSCRMAASLGADVMTGFSRWAEEHRAEATAILKDHAVKLAFENHPEKTPEELLARIEPFNGWIGAGLDTGWFAIVGYPADKALRAVSHCLLDVHLKDVRRPGFHETCLYGEGVAPVRECVHYLKALGYQGALGVEHEPAVDDPSPVCVQCRELVEQWLK